MPTPTGSSQIELVALTGDSNVDALLSGSGWAGTTVSYSFPGTTATFLRNYPDPDFLTRIVQLTSTQQSAAVNALGAWANVGNLSFVSNADNAATVGDIRIAFSASFAWGTSVGQAYFPSTSAAGGDVWLDPAANDIVNARLGSSLQSSSFAPGSFAYYVILHELGHALGLKHPFATFGTNQAVIDPAYDSNLYTLMSYTVLADHPDALGFTYWPTTPMLFDVAAMQAIYGSNTHANAGDTTYSFNDNFGQSYFQTIWDSGGSNAISYTGNTPVTIDLHQGAGSQIGNRIYAYTATNARAYVINNVWIADGTHIDTAMVNGTGSNTLIGNDDGNVLVGGAGNDTIRGGLGNDVLVGNGGNDVIDGGGGLDQANFAGTLASYAVTAGSSSISVRSLSGIEGSDVLTHVERLHFSDRGLAFDVDGTAGEAFRLYQAAFNRVPDLSGLGYWIAQLDGGTTLQSVANFFDHSAEFQSLYGANPGNGDFVSLLYQNVLHRTPDQGGFDYWMGQLGAGKIDFTGLLMYFSESPENHTQTATAVQNGIQYLFYAG